MKTTKLLINNLNIGNTSPKEANVYVKKQHKRLSKKLNLPKRVKLMVNGYNANNLGHKPLFEIIEL